MNDKEPLPDNHPDFAEWLNSHNPETMAKTLRESGCYLVADILSPCPQEIVKKSID